MKKEGRIIEDCENFFKQDTINTGISIIPKKVLKKWKRVNFTDSEPNFVVIYNITSKKKCYIIELKDGNNFDTKKSKGGKRTLLNFETSISKEIPYKTSIYICCFNTENKKEIEIGLKKN